jgi:outer membrane lipoprotein-sorting protein
MTRNGSILAIVIMLAATGSVVAAEDPVTWGEAIARKADSRDRGYGDSKAVLVMILEDRKGRIRERRLNIQTLEAPDEKEGEKSLVIFDEPRDIKGTALLSYAHVLEPDDQWLYLPALKRVKRISSINKSGSFVGSEFAYEDITGQEFGKYSYKWLRDEPCGDLECFVVERRPQYENSGYTRLVTWYDKTEYRIQRIDYYDLKDKFLKTLTFSEYRQYLGRFWRPQRLVMDNDRTGRTTRLLYENYEFQTGLNENDFSQGSLKRAR